jgi:uncharacterized surface protein with fasciclin (FAS1) repeats
MRRRAFLSALGTGAALGLAGCGGGARPTGAARSGPDVLGVARANGMARFARAAETADLGDALAGAGPFTLFAPTDRAFAASDAGRLRGDPLRRLVAYHVVPGQLTSDFLEGRDVNHTTLLGSGLNVDGSGGVLRVNGAAVTRADLMAANGVVFAIDRVLTPR